MSIPEEGAVLCEGLNQEAGVVFYNGKVITVDPKNSIKQAVAVSGNRIAAVGTNEDALALAGKNTRRIDLGGRTLMPGLIDTHYHPILYGLLEPGGDGAMIDIFYRNCKTLAACFDVLKEAAALRKKDEWISLFGYEPSLFPENRHPTLEELDAIAPDNPVQFMHGGGHICMYNTRALAYLDVYSAGDAGKYPAGEVVVENGKLTGMVRGHTHFRLWGKVNYPEAAQEKAAMKAHRRCLEKGITSIHDCGEMGKTSIHLMQKLCRTGKFKVRVNMMLHSIFGKPYSKEMNAHWLELGFLSGLGDEHFRMGACKFMIDGGSGAPSCATREPYSHDPNLTGERGWEREEAAEYIGMIHNAECQATAHAIGDLAVEFMVEGYEKAFAKNPRPDLRHRIEHCTLADADLIKRMAKMNICPSVNVSCLQKLGIKMRDFYGERNKYLCAIRTMLDEGVMCSIHSDLPSYEDGLTLIDAAVNRYDRMNNFQCDKTQAVSVPEAIRCATYNGAYASFEETKKGSLEAGKLADMIVLSGDILGIDPMNIPSLSVDMTMIDGIIEYQR